MRILDSQTKRALFLAALSIGERLQVRCMFTGDRPDTEHTAEVIEVYDDYAQVQIEIEGIAGGKIESLQFDDGESLLTTIAIDDEDVECWFEVAEEQPEFEPETEIAESATAAHAEIEAKPITGTVSGPGTAVSVADPVRPVSWFLSEAALLDAEAAKYRQYSPPQQALTGAANQLRSAVGHVMQGGHEKAKDASAPDPF